MEIIYIVLVFIAPGLISQEIRKIKHPLSKSDPQTKRGQVIYERMMKMVVYSIIISGITFSIMQLIYWKAEKKFLYKADIGQIINSLSSLKIAAIFIVIIILIGVIYEFALREPVTKAYFNKVNKRLEEKYQINRATEEGYNVWQNIFFKERGEDESLPVSIYINGEYITSGYISSTNEGEDEEKEITLSRCKEMEAIYNVNKSKLKQDRWLQEMDIRYFNIGTGTMIKFYDPKPIEEHWGDFEI